MNKFPDKNASRKQEKYHASTVKLFQRNIVDKFPNLCPRNNAFKFLSKNAIIILSRRQRKSLGKSARLFQESFAKKYPRGYLEKSTDIFHGISAKRKRVVALSDLDSCLEHNIINATIYRCTRETSRATCLNKRNGRDGARL